MPRSETPTPFPETRWSVVFELRSSSEPARQKAMSELCEIYWKPLYASARFSGHSAHDAEDLTQGFFARLLRRGNLGPLTPDQGRFRTFLKSAFRNYTIDAARRENRQKRGGGAEWLSLDFASGERQYQRALADSSTPGDGYDRVWAHTLLGHAIAALRRKYEERGRAETLRQLEVFLEADTAAPSYAEIATRLGQSENTIAANVSRLRREFRTLLRQEVAETLADPLEVDDELRYLLRAAA